MIRKVLETVRHYPKGEAVEIRCPHCEQKFKDHIQPDLKCVFEASTFGVGDEIRIVLANEINRPRLERGSLTVKHGDVWDVTEVKQAFQLKAFLAPFTWAIRRRDEALGILTFQHLPRYYFSFMEA